MKSVVRKSILSVLTVLIALSALAARDVVTLEHKASKFSAAADHQPIHCHRSEIRSLRASNLRTGLGLGTSQHLICWMRTDELQSGNLCDIQSTFSGTPSRFSSLQSLGIKLQV